MTPGNSRSSRSGGNFLDFQIVLLNGQIIERQRDRFTREVKTRIRGRTLGAREAEAIVKNSFTGSLFVITIYLV